VTRLAFGHRIGVPACVLLPPGESYENAAVDAIEAPSTHCLPAGAYIAHHIL